MKRAFRGRQPWPVVAGVFLPTVVLGLVLFGLAMWTARGTGSEPSVPGRGGSSEADATGDAITTFAAFTSEGSVGRQTLPDHEFAAAGVHRLADAFSAISRQMEAARDPHAPGAADIDELRTLAVRLEASPLADHGALVGRAFDLTTSVLTGLQQERFSALADAVEAMRETTQQFVPAGGLPEQRTVVERYFEQSSDVLRAMWKMGL